MKSLHEYLVNESHYWKSPKGTFDVKFAEAITKKAEPHTVLSDLRGVYKALEWWDELYAEPVKSWDIQGENLVFTLKDGTKYVWSTFEEEWQKQK